jgi:hypothetical protein
MARVTATAMLTVKAKATATATATATVMATATATATSTMMKAVPAKPGVVSFSTMGWMRSLATRLLELPG